MMRKMIRAYRVEEDQLNAEMLRILGSLSGKTGYGRFVRGIIIMLLAVGVAVIIISL